MMQSQSLLPSWPSDNVFSSTIDNQFEPFGLHFHGCDSSEISSISHFSTMFSGEIFPYPDCDDLLLQDFSVPLEGLESMLTDRIEDLYNCLDDSTQDSSLSQLPQSQDVWSPSPSTRSSGSMQSSLTLTGEAMEIDNRLSIFHLLKAYGEATENNQTELAEVVLRCASEKGSPVGETWERVAFNLSQDIQNQSDYLVQESSKNFEAAFRVFYQMFPYGRFAHFSANSAIIEAMPSDADMLHIVDFDIGDGIQWPPLIEAMACQQKALRLTSIRWGEEDLGRSPWRFEDTRSQLCAHARSFGLNLKVDEMGIEDLVNELNKMKKQGGSGTREWLAFNCMVGLPHMGKSKGRKLVNRFLNAAKEALSRNKGIITFGDGDAYEKQTGFGTFFDGQLMHYNVVLESMESNFSKQLVQARMAMEHLFVAPNICAQVLVQKWKDMNETGHFEAGITLEGLKVSRERLMEAKEIVREGDNSYEVSIGGNYLALEWRGTTLVRISCWRN
ncbi:hypothetical protein PTKIN_Ptkin06aG0005000 [Pterospermum kingtungense]